MKLMNILRRNWWFILSAILIFLTLYPSLFLILHEKTYSDFGLVIDQVGRFSRNINFIDVSISYYLTLYGTVITSVAVAYKFFEFNSQSYYFLSLILRILAAFSIYYFVSKWSKSKLAGFISSLYFGVNFAGIQNTTWVTLFLVYLEVVFIVIFLDKWWSFHYAPTRKNARSSIVYFIISILVYPARVVNLLLLLIAGEIYWFIKSYKNKISYPLGYSLVLLLIVGLLFFFTRTLTASADIQSKMISINILLRSLITGYPPLITTPWFFISNLIIPPCCTLIDPFNSASKLYTIIPEYLPKSTIQTITNILPITSLIFLIVLFFKKKFLFAFISLILVIFPLSISHSQLFLAGWLPSWVLYTQLGGIIFLWSILILIFFIWNQNRKLAEIGLLGSLIVVVGLLFPWLISPQVSMDDQSAFNPLHRYYTLPSVGMGLLLSSVFVFFIELIKVNLAKNITSMKEKINLPIFFKMILSNSIYSIFPLTTILILLLHVSMTYDYLVIAGQGINARKIDIFWNRIKPIFEDIKDGMPAKLVYVENNGELNEDYIKDFFLNRVSIYLGQIQTLPKVSFVFNTKELENVDIQNFYAFKFIGEDIVDIKKEVIESIDK